jgi:NTP pyrophosphatase (non-canonical NTP hydrolase)
MSDALGTGNQDVLLELRNVLRQFASDRDWDKFHSPKNLAIALSVEAAELLEHFQWLSDAESADLSVATRIRVREELADVLLYLIRLADKAQCRPSERSCREDPDKCREIPSREGARYQQEIHGALSYPRDCLPEQQKWVPK